MSGTKESGVGLALLYPDLLGTYGDSGNAIVLAQRLLWRGYRVEAVTVRSGERAPSGCQVYVLGGGEDLPQEQAARQLGTQGGSPLRRAVDAGAAVLGVCAGMQVLGERFVLAGGDAEGLGLLDLTTTSGRRARAVGEVVVDCDPALGIGVLTGYENHSGVTALGRGCRPVGSVRVGVGNGDGSGFEGAWSGRVLGTYLHGPVLARNPALADLVLSWAVGDLAPLDDSEEEALRSERLKAAMGKRARLFGLNGWRRRPGAKPRFGSPSRSA
jgi:CobQ-like glutamine amidotransferase family enzyme